MILLSILRIEDFEAREDSLAGVDAILSTMAAPKYGTSDLQSSMLQKALRSVWDEKKSKAEITSRQIFWQFY